MNFERINFCISLLSNQNINLCGANTCKGDSWSLNHRNTFENQGTMMFPQTGAGQWDAAALLGQGAVIPTGGSHMSKKASKSGKPGLNLCPLTAA